MSCQCIARSSRAKLSSIQYLINQLSRWPFLFLCITSIQSLHPALLRRYISVHPEKINRTNYGVVQHMTAQLLLLQCLNTTRNNPNVLGRPSRLRPRRTRMQPKARRKNWNWISAYQLPLLTVHYSACVSFSLFETPSRGIALMNKRTPRVCLAESVSFPTWTGQPLQCRSRPLPLIHTA